VLGEKAGVGGDAAPCLADGTGAEDGFGRQAEEDVGYVVVGKATDGRRFCSCFCSFSRLVHPSSYPCSAMEKMENASHPSTFHILAPPFFLRNIST
jgi:hypothetical protein